MIQKFPYLQTSLPELNILQNRWISILNTICGKLLLDGVYLEGVSLNSGVTTVNHKLGRKPQGYILCDQDAAASIYRSQPFNDLTLTLTSSAAVTVAIWVF